jgi:hypothetical protein
MATTVPQRADALMALGALHDQAARLSELDEELHAKTCAFESFIDSVFTQVNAVAIHGIEGGGELELMYENVVEKQASHIDRERTLELYEAATELGNAVDAAVMRERNREEEHLVEGDGGS